MALNLVPFLAPMAAKYAGKQLFGSGGGRTQAQIEAERSRLSGQRDRYDMQANQYFEDMGAARDTYNREADSYQQLLSNPYATSADDTAELDRAQASGIAAGERAGSRVRSSLARRGITDSSATTGAETAIASSQAAQRASSANQLAMERIRQREARRRQLVSFVADRLARGERGFAGAMGGSNQITGQLLAQYGGQRNLELMQEGQRDEDLSAFAGEIGKLLAQGGKF